MMIKQKRCFWILIYSIVITLLVLSVLIPTYAAYSHNMVGQAIIEYMKSNDNQWPSSWSDIEPFHTDLFLPMQSTVLSRRFNQVAWDINVADLIQEATSGPVSEYGDYQAGRFPVVYRRSSLEEYEQKEWVATQALRRYLKGLGTTDNANAQ